MSSLSAPDKRALAPKPGQGRAWKAVALLSTGLLLLWMALFFGDVFGRPGLSWRPRLETAAAAQTATEFLTRYLTFSSARIQQTALLDLMTPEFQQAFQVIWRDPKLLSAIQKRAVQVSVAADLPVFTGQDDQGNCFFTVSGRVTVTSPVTAIHSIERAFSGTLMLRKTDHGYKIANAVWDNQRSQ